MTQLDFENASQAKNYVDPAEIDDLWCIMRRHLKLIASTLFVFVCAAFLITSQMPERFEARSTVLMSGFSTRVDTDRLVLEDHELTWLELETKLSILKTREFAAEIANVMSLYDNPGLLGAPISSLKVSERLPTEKLVDLVLESYSARQSGQSLAIDISAIASSPDTAMNLANTVATTFTEYIDANRRKGIAQSVKYFEERAEALQKELAQAEAELTAFVYNQGIKDIKIQNQLSLKIRPLIERLNTLHTDLASERRKIHTESERVAEKAEVLDTISAQFTLERKLNQIDILHTLILENQKKIDEVQTYLSQIDSEADQISVASLPQKPFWPNVPVTLVFSGAIGFALSIFFSLVLESSSVRIRNEKKLEFLTGLPNLGYMPSAKSRGFLKKKDLRDFFTAQLSGIYLSKLLNVLRNGWLTRDPKQKLLMITSALPNEGKSALTACLSLSASLNHMKVLVIDLDSHRWGVSKLLNAQNEPVSTSEMLTTKLEPESIAIEGFSNCELRLLRFDTKDHCSITELSHLIKALREFANLRYDLVVIDTPPVLLVDDACRIGPSVDQTLLVVRSGATTGTTIIDAIRKLGSNNIAIFGTFMTGESARQHEDRSYGAFAASNLNEASKGLRWKR